VTTAPLCGAGLSLATRDALAWEQSILAGHADWLKALEQAGMQQERRRAILRTNDLRWRWKDNALELHFSLSSGSYATSLIRELVNIREITRDEDSGQ
jgi:tRNA pseudouridine13 synthase